MRGFPAPLLAAVALFGANIALAQSPPTQGRPEDSLRQPTLGTGSCSGALGSEPGCRRPQTVSGAEPDNASNSDKDQVGSHTPSTDRMGPNSVARGGSGTGQSGQGGSGADGLGGGDSGR